MILRMIPFFILVCFLGWQQGYTVMGFTRSVMIPCQINSRITNSHTLSPATLIHPPSLKYVHTRFGASQRWATNDEAGDQEGTKETTKDKDSIEKPSDEVSGILESSDTSNTLMQRIKNYFSPPNDGLTFRQRLAKLGLAVALSYGWVSNMSYSVTVSLAWYIFSKRTGMSPLAPGQWKGFLAIYAGFFVFNNLVRPIRLALAVGVSPQFDRFIAALQHRLKVNKAIAITITVLLANVIGTFGAMFTGISVASVLSGVPLWAR